MCLKGHYAGHRGLRRIRIEDSDEVYIQIVAKTLDALHLAGLGYALIGVPFPCVCNVWACLATAWM